VLGCIAVSYPDRSAELSEDLRIIVGGLGVPVTRCTRDLKYVWVSPAYAELVDRRVDEINGRAIADVIGGDALATIRPYIERVLAGERVEYEDHVAYRGRGRRWIHAIYTPTFEGMDAPTGWIAVVRDVTVQRDAERAVRESEVSRQLLSAIVESADDAIVSKDLNSIITSWNVGAERMFGYMGPEVIGRSIRVIIPADRQSEEEHILSEIRRGERVEEFETVRQRKDGALIPVSLRISPIRLTSGEIIGASNVARDISDQKRAAERAAFLAEVGSVLAASLDYESTLKAIANLAVPYVADWCAVDITRSNGAIERLAVSHIDPSKIAFAQMVRNRYEDAEAAYSVAFVIRHGTPALVPKISDRDDRRVGAR
jgi:PAS domain S-box-containing protein